MLNRPKVTAALIFASACLPVSARAEEPRPSAAVRDYFAQDARWAAGYFNTVTEPHEAKLVQQEYEKRFAVLGIRAKVEGCEMMSVVSAGVANGAYAYGAYCKVRINDRASQHLLLCSNNLGPFHISSEQGFGVEGFMEPFIRSTCW